MTEQQECRHCGRRIVNVDGRWIDPEATGDDSVWRETCDSHDTFDAVHEPKQQAGHTPGPWAVDEGNKVWADENAEYLFTEVVCVADGHPRAAQALAYVWDDDRFGGESENSANARLIAAAPDLLDALRVVEAHTDREWISGRAAGGEALNRVRLILHDTAAAAIEKATGR